jgi:hypothetical protein
VHPTDLFSLFLKKEYFDCIYIIDDDAMPSRKLPRPKVRGLPLRKNSGGVRVADFHADYIVAGSTAGTQLTERSVLCHSISQTHY